MCSLWHTVFVTIPPLHVPKDGLPGDGQRRSRCTYVQQDQGRPIPMIVQDSSILIECCFKRQCGAGQSPPSNPHDAVLHSEFGTGSISGRAIPNARNARIVSSYVLSLSSQYLSPFQLSKQLGEHRRRHSPSVFNSNRLAGKSYEREHNGFPTVQGVRGDMTL